MFTLQTLRSAFRIGSSAEWAIHLFVTNGNISADLGFSSSPMDRVARRATRATLEGYPTSVSDSTI
jgi:hypothetical protein